MREYTKINYGNFYNYLRLAEGEGWVFCQHRHVNKEIIRIITETFFTPLPVQSDGYTIHSSNGNRVKK